MSRHSRLLRLRERFGAIVVVVDWEGVERNVYRG